MKEYQRILVVQTAFLGDVVLSIPVLISLRKLYPSAFISFVTTAAARELVAGLPEINEVIVFDKQGADSGVRGLFKTASILRRGNFDIVFSLHRSWRTAVLLKLSGIRERIGFDTSRLGFLYTKRVPRLSQPHDVLRNLAILRSVVGEQFGACSEVRVGITEEHRNRTQRVLADLGVSGRYIAIAPGSVWATKRWTKEGFSAVAQVLASNGVSVLLVGGASEWELAECVAGGQKLVYNLCGKLSIIESAVVIEGASALVCNDSSPLHLASAVKTPVVAIFCSTTPEFGFGPWEVPNEIVEVSGLPCRPCGRHGHKQCPTGTQACMLGVAPGAVLAAVFRIAPEIDEICKAS